MISKYSFSIAALVVVLAQTMDMNLLRSPERFKLVGLRTKNENPSSHRESLWASVKLYCFFVFLCCIMCTKVVNIPLMCSHCTGFKFIQTWIDMTLCKEFEATHNFEISKRIKAFMVSRPPPSG